MRPSIGFGDEASATVGLDLADRTVSLSIALFSLAATPEHENHGAFLDRLRESIGARLIALVDEAPYRRRLGATSPARTRASKSGGAAWSAFLAAHQVGAAFVDLAAPDLAQLERTPGAVLAGARMTIEPATIEIALISAHQRRQDDAGAHAARPRRRRGARRAARHRRRRVAHAADERRRRRAAPDRHAGLRRLREARAAAARGRQPARLAAARSVGPLQRPSLLVQPAGGARGARQRGGRAVPRQRRRGPARRRLRRVRDAGAALDRQAGPRAAEPGRARRAAARTSSATSSAGGRTSRRTAS